MAKGLYGAINGSTRKITKNYAVVDGVTRKIKKIYAVVDGVTRLAWSSDEELEPLYKGIIYAYDLYHSSASSIYQYYYLNHCSRSGNTLSTATTINSNINSSFTLWNVSNDGQYLAYNLSSSYDYIYFFKYDISQNQFITYGERFSSINICNQLNYIDLNIINVRFSKDNSYAIFVCTPTFKNGSGYYDRQAVLVFLKNTGSGFEYEKHIIFCSNSTTFSLIHTCSSISVKTSKNCEYIVVTASTYQNDANNVKHQYLFIFKNNMNSCEQIYKKSRSYASESDTETFSTFSNISITDDGSYALVPQMLTESTKPNYTESRILYINDTTVTEILDITSTYIGSNAFDNLKKSYDGNFLYLKYQVSSLWTYAIDKATITYLGNSAATSETIIDDDTSDEDWFEITHYHTICDEMENDYFLETLSNYGCWYIDGYSDSNESVSPSILLTKYSKNINGLITGFGTSTAILEDHNYGSANSYSIIGNARFIDKTY